MQQGTSFAVEARPVMALSADDLEVAITPVTYRRLALPLAQMPVASPVTLGDLAEMPARYPGMVSRIHVLPQSHLRLASNTDEYLHSDRNGGSLRWVSEEDPWGGLDRRTPAENLLKWFQPRAG
jgi:hypothetical protein